ncbi:hypothetical protein BRD09_08235 [Halobacteriales archaeon SW_10_68_16]|jgi:hypothetical protein|nr:MAG: hypothetical protein BRD09_08235 [Halobacteriales archaeon SW_10_68_16]
MDDRGQTLQDYLLGILLVLLTIASVFAFFPEIFVPFGDPGDPGNQEMADELADEVVAVNATFGREGTVDTAGLNRTLRDPDGFGRLVNRSGIPDWKGVNVTVRDGDRVVFASETATVGSVYRENSSGPAATRARTIRGVNESMACADGCRVVVRVWGGG